MNWRSKLHIVALSCSVLAGSACWVLSAEGDVEPPADGSQTAYIPAPQPVRTPILIGAHHCPLWEADKPQMWANVVKHPERTPALGFYSQENPEIADWETKWAVEHGVSFFIYCWYRTSQGEPVKMRFGTAIHDALFKSRFVDKMKFTIMWENQSRGNAGVADERDLMENLLPFWIENYFRHPSYLKVDNKPLLFIYRPSFSSRIWARVENVARALDRMRQACREAGFDGLYLLGEYRGLDANHLQLMKTAGARLHLRLLLARAEQPLPRAGDRGPITVHPQDAGAGDSAAGRHGFARLERLARRREYLEDPAQRVRRRCCIRPRTSSALCQTSNWAAGCCCWTTGTSGARATTSLLIVNSDSATSMPSAMSSLPLRVPT